eukprot:1102791_1
MAAFANMLLFVFVVLNNFPMQSAQNVTGTDSTTTTDAVESTQFMTTQILTNVEEAIVSFRDALQDSFCKDGLGVGGPKCDQSFYGMQEFINSFDAHMNIDPINASKKTQEIADILNHKVSVRSAMLHNLSNALLSSCALYADDVDSNEITDFDSLFFAGSNEQLALLPSDMEYSSIYNGYVSLSSSTFRIPHNIDYDNERFQFDATISSLLDPLFNTLYEEHCAPNVFLSRPEEQCKMYFGSINGMFRMFPGSENPKNGTGYYKSYDPRLRPWYVSAASSDMDIVILLDLSGSMVNRIDLVVEGLLSIFDMLSVLSFVNIIGFSDRLQRTCLNDRLFEATQENFDYLEDWLNNELSFSGHSNFKIALEAGYDLITSHRVINDNNCNTAMLLVTDSGNDQDEDELLEFISAKTSIVDLNVEDVQIFTYTIGGDADEDLAAKLAEYTGGAHTHIHDSEEFIADKMSLFYNYYALSQDVNTQVTVSPPYFSFSTGDIQITLSLPMFINGSFIGVFGTDIPLNILENAIGDAPIGEKSYSFVMNDNGILLLHPSIPSIIDYENGLYDEFQTISAAEVEPSQFVGNGVFQSMLNRESGYVPMTMSYQQSAGDANYDGFVELDTDVIYFYYPIGTSSLAFATVVWDDDRYTAPLISSFGLDSVKPQICPVHDNIQNISDLKADEMDGCLGPFNLFHEVDLLLRCNDTEEWIAESELQNINTQKHNYNGVFSQADFYNGKNISLKYSTYFLQAGLWEVKSDALKGLSPTCDELNNIQRMANPLRLSPKMNSIPYGGFKYEFSANTMVSIYVFSSLFNWWKPVFLQPNSKIVSLWFGSYAGIHFSYPGKRFSSTYNPLNRPWYKEAMAFPDYFVLPPPYLHATTGKLVTGASTAIYAPGSTDQFIGVAGFNWEYSGFVEKWKSVMTDVCHGEYSFNQCYLITASGYFLYYEDMEYDVNDEDISHKFLGETEPTLMQALLDLNLFTKNTHLNIVDKTTSLTYKLDERVFIDGLFSTTPRRFEKNSGSYTIHHIENTNLYVVFIYEYLQIAYPILCPDDEWCTKVETPGCVKSDSNNDGYIDADDECYVFDDQDVCSTTIANTNYSLNIDKSEKCIAKKQTVVQCLLDRSKSQTFDMCTADLHTNLKYSDCTVPPWAFSDGEIAGIIIGSVFGVALIVWCIGLCGMCWCDQYVMWRCCNLCEWNLCMCCCNCPPRYEGSSCLCLYCMDPDDWEPCPHPVNDRAELELEQKPAKDVVHTEVEPLKQIGKKSTNDVKEEEREP